MFDEEVMKLMEQIYAERFPDATLESLKQKHTTHPLEPGNENPFFDQTAYAADLKQLLLDSQPVTSSELQTLAHQRAAAVADALTADGGLDSSRVHIIDAVVGESRDGEWVAMELGATHD